MPQSFMYMAKTGQKLIFMNEEIDGRDRERGRRPQGRYGGQVRGLRWDQASWPRLWVRLGDTTPPSRSPHS